MVRILVSPTTRECDWHQGRDQVYRGTITRNKLLQSDHVTSDGSFETLYNEYEKKGDIEPEDHIHYRENKGMCDRNRTVSTERLLRASMGTPGLHTRRQMGTRDVSTNERRRLVGR
ncbi:hypothetical protein J6590_089583 [Homalodisca vitripennis]|nr:hypothetical protein J6590_089583 [Homalodisca vitripennis]